MIVRRSACRIALLLVAILLLASMLAGCQRSGRTAVSGATSAAAKNAPVAATATRRPTRTPAPTRTQEVFPPTYTPTPFALLAEPTRTFTPTATLNVPQTMVALKTANVSTKCNKYGDAWLINVAPAWKAGWCQMTGTKSMYATYYEYNLIYPSEWMVTTFGDLTPNVYFYTYQKDVEVRLYQVYNYSTRKYEGTLEDAPVKAGFCDENDHCTPAVGSLEKILNKEITSIGGKKVLILDSQDGKYNIRRYFFFVPFKYYQPQSNRLFFVKLYTPDPVNGNNYATLEQQIDDIITSVEAK